MPLGPVAESPKALTLPVGKAATALALYEGGQKLYNQGKEIWRNKFAYSVTVSEKDSLYEDIHRWLLSIMPDERHRTLLVSSNGSRSSEDGMSEEPLAAYDPGLPRSSKSPQSSRSPLTIKFDDTAKRKVRIGGHDITVQLHTPEVQDMAKLTREPPASKIYFIAMSYAGQQAVIHELERINSERATERKAVLRMVGQWGSWKIRSDVPTRSLDSVALPMIKKNRIVDDLAYFLGNEGRYNRLAIPWHRGYMFYGPPGTGKTSIVKALANCFNLDLWYISLGSLLDESSLLGLLAEVNPRSILLLEDIDTVKIVKDRDAAKQGGINMGSLLQMLDGVATPHGLITMMTTNHFEVLDDALTRPGRMDLIEEISWPTTETLAAMFKHFFDREPSGWGVLTDKPIEGVSTSQIAEIFKQNLDDPEKAELDALAAFSEPKE